MTTNRKKFTRAEEGSNNSVIYHDEDGNKLIRYWKSYEGQPVGQASTRSWRNNNPGNFITGDFSTKNGAIGHAGTTPDKKFKFAVFPDYETGRKAQAKRLKEGSLYIDLTLNELTRKYTGVKPSQPDTEEAITYRKNIKAFTKLDMGRTIRSLNEVEYETLLDAMKRHEGWKEGKEEYIEVKKILGTHFNDKRVIIEFLVGDSAGKAWISKQDAIALAEEGRLHAIVVHRKNGAYLRPEYHQTPFKNLICMVSNEEFAIV